jgi:hypothetical protein
MFEKLPFPLTNLEPVDRALRAMVDRLMRFELVGNFFGTPTNGQIPTYNAAEKRWEPKAPSGGAGVTDHGALTGLADDDHSQYHNNARGDARYSQLGHAHAISDVTGLAASIDAIELGGIGVTIDGSGSAVTTGLKALVVAPFSGVIAGWDLVADQLGSIVIDVWKTNYAGAPPTVANSIAGTEKPTLTAAQKNQDLSLSTWTTTVTAGDVFAFNIDSAATVQKVSLTLRVTKA